MTPNQLREEAAKAELIARLVSLKREKDWLAAKAAELRHQAERLETKTRRSPRQ
jgi:hypothetical protein